MDKIVNDYLNNCFQINPYQLTEDDQNIFKQDKSLFIQKKIARKRFRKQKMSDNLKKQIKKKVDLSLRENRSLHFTIPFGGYKHFWNPSHPEPDWAEIFNLLFLTEYTSPILAVHKPGVIVEYISEDIILSRMDNYPKKSLDIYSEKFRKLLEWFSKYIPSNLQFRYNRLADKLDQTKIIAQIEKILPERRKAFDKLSETEKSKELHRSYRSLMWKGEKDLTSLSEKEKQDRIIESRLIELAYYEIEAQPECIGDYLGGDNHICIDFSFGLSPDNVFRDLTLGSTFSSTVDYWIGRGILEYRNNKLTPRILSKKQYEQVEKDLKKIEIKPALLPFQNYSFIEIS
ncbi:MAG: hypothetical protein HYW86_01635 [Candidatus Roizmanbacteria bacterium]|nr:MAG: hypothetical protein HYW86_01635 [Candidatus Roizmanbacteria bacterium]